jgi:integrase
LSIKKSDSGEWLIDIYVTENGKKKRIRNKSFPTKKAAEAYVAKRKASDPFSSSVEDNFFKLQFRDIAELYKKHLEGTRAKANISYVNNLLEKWGDHTISAVSPSEVRLWIKEMLASREYQISTIEKHLTYLKTIFNYAMQMEKINRNPLLMVKFKKEFSRKTVRNYTMDVEEFKEFLKLFNGAKWYMEPIMILLYHCGWRIGEILTLTWDEVDLKNGFITKAADKTKEAKSRIGALESEAMKVFTEIEKIQKGRKGPYIFGVTGEKPLTYQTYYKNYKGAKEGSKWSNFNIHDQRHSYTKRKRQEGADKEVIKLQQGHSTDSMFARYNDIDTAELTEMSGFNERHKELIRKQVEDVVKIMRDEGISTSTLMTVVRECW